MHWTQQEAGPNHNWHEETSGGSRPGEEEDRHVAVSDASGESSQSAERGSDGGSR